MSDDMRVKMPALSSPSFSHKRLLRTLAIACTVAAALLAIVYASLLGQDDTPVAPAAVDIRGGSDAEEGEFPWQIYLRIGTGPFDQSICGGSLIAPRFIVTAAHCVGIQSSSPANAPAIPNLEAFTVIAGEHDLSITSGHEQTRTVVQALIHPEYYPAWGKNDNDIALLKLDRPVILNEWVQPITLAQMPADAPLEALGSPSTQSGWGWSWTDSYPDILQKATLPLSNSGSCNSPAVHTGISLCNHEQTPVSGSTCGGDSGGPVVAPGADGKWKLIGVTYKGPPCESVSPIGSLFVRVSHYHEWIMQAIGTVDGLPRMQNGNFESSDPLVWTLASSVQITSTNLPVAPASGTRMAVLGGAGGTQGSIRQLLNLSIPPTQLRLKYQVRSTNVNCTTDTAGFYLPTGILAGSLQLCTANATTAWQEMEIDLTPYAGRSSYLLIQVNKAMTSTSTLYVDDVEVLPVEMPEVSIDAFSPHTTSAGVTTDVVISGTEFFDVTGVRIGAQSMPFTITSNSALVAKVTLAAGRGPVVLAAPYGEYASADEFATEHTLTVAKSGSGDGVVVATDASINCGAVCVASKLYGEEVILQAAASPGSVFSGWSGACSGTGICVVPMDGTASVNAIFMTNSNANKISAPATIVAGKPAAFATTLQLAGVQSCQWSFGDGKSAACDLEASAAGIDGIAISTTHTFAATGTYTVSVTAANLAGEVRNAVRVTVSAPDTNVTPSPTPVTPEPSPGPSPEPSPEGTPTPASRVFLPTVRR